MASNVIGFKHPAIKCCECLWRENCIAADVSEMRGGALDSEAWPRKAFKSGASIHVQGQLIDHVSILRAGSAKAVVGDDSGAEQIVAFLFPGDLLGAVAMGGGGVSSSIITLEQAAVCRVPYRVFNDPHPTLWSNMMRAIARQERAVGRHLLSIGQHSAHERFAYFLLNLSARYASCGLAPDEFNLPMSRQDIANYLGLAVETVSRLFGELDAMGLIAVERRFVRLPSLADLEAYAAGEPMENAHANDLNQVSGQRI
ncbi:MAG: helix-turn-helix domain-containing protein [Pseudomonadota bacterium]